MYICQSKAKKMSISGKDKTFEWCINIDFTNLTTLRILNNVQKYLEFGNLCVRLGTRVKAPPIILRKFQVKKGWDYSRQYGNRCKHGYEQNTSKMTVFLFFGFLW